ncbi:MAG: PAS domain S-box protein [Anaerolineales bacterium]
MLPKSNTQPVDWTIWLQAQRRRAVETLLRFILVLGGAGVLYSLSQVIAQQRIGLNFVYFSLSYLVVLILYFNKRIPDEWRGVGFQIVLIVFGILAFYSGWLVSSGRAVLLAAVVVGSILIGPRVGLWTAAISMFIYAAYAIAYGSGWLVLQPLPDPTTPPPMIIEGIGFGMMLVVVAAGQWLFGQALRAAAESNRAAQESRDSFSNIVDRSTDGMIVVDSMGIVRFVNMAAQVFFGRSKNELVGNPFPLAERGQDGQEVEIWLADGHRGVADLRFIDTQWEGAPARLILVRDISERRQSEGRFNQAFHASPVAMAMVSLKRGFIDVNKALCELYGFSREELVGRFARDLNIWVDQPAYEQFLGYFQRNETVKNFEYRFRRKNGEIHIGLVSLEKNRTRWRTGFHRIHH